MGLSKSISILFGVFSHLRLSYSRLGPSLLPLEEDLAENLETRQASGVIATSEFLRRGYHASAVAGNWLYIDGGDFSFTNEGHTVYQYSNTLLSIDLAQNWTNATVTINSNTKPTGTPNLNKPSLWYHEQEGVLYSGFAGASSPFAKPDSLPPQSLWSFKPDGTGGGSWTEVISPNAAALNGVTQPVNGLQAYGPNSAWYLGGFPAQDPFWSNGTQWIHGMIKFDMASQSFTNISASDNYTDGSTVVNGGMHYVPSFGPDGIVVVMGGISLPYNKSGLVSFETVSIMDPAKGEWFNQTTTGNAPSPREDFCVAGINSTNNTYEIFVYAGWGTNLGFDAVQYDTIDILTLPAFHWISVPYNPQNPRAALTCNAVGGSQIVTIGGVDANSDLTFAAGLGNYESTYNTSADPFSQGLAIFDMTTLQFVDQYTAGVDAYEQSDPVKAFYSQSQNNYQRNLTPGVAALLNVTHFTTTTIPTPSSPSTNTSTPLPQSPHHISAGTIAGSVVGALAFTAILALTILYLHKRKRAAQDAINRQKAAEEAPYAKDQPGFHEMPDEKRPQELDPQPLVEMGPPYVAEIGHPATPVGVHEL